MASYRLTGPEIGSWFAATRLTLLSTDAWISSCLRGEGMTAQPPSRARTVASVMPRSAKLGRGFMSGPEDGSSWCCDCSSGPGN